MTLARPTGPAAPAPQPMRAARRLSPLTPVVRAPLVMLAFLSASWQQLFRDEGVGTIGLILVVLLAAGGLYGLTSWLRTTYWIAGDELRIDTGVVARQSRRIRIDRLQGVDILQPLVARFFGLAELRFDVAGGDSEGRLAFLPRREAEQLRSLLLVRRDQLRRVEAPAASYGPGPGPEHHDGPVEPARLDQGPVRLVARLDVGRLVGSLLLSAESLFLAAAIVAILAASLGTRTLELAGGVVPAAIAAAVSLTRKLTGYYGFTLTESAEGLQVRRGLTSLSSQTVALERVQGVVVREPLLWRPLGWARLDVSVAGNLAGDTGKPEASSTLMPVAPRAEVLALARSVLLGRDLAAVPVIPAPTRARWLAPLTAWNLA